jgi:hypothetical protein
MGCAEQGSARSGSPGGRYLNGLTSRFARPAKAKPLFGRGRQRKRRGWVAGGTMQYLLILLVVITMACGAAASVTISLAPVYGDNSGKGY